MKKLMQCFLGMLVILSLNACSNAATKPATERETSDKTQQTATEKQQKERTDTESEKTEQTSEATAETEQTTEIAASEKALSLEDFWKSDGEGSSDTLTFITGLEIVLPDHWMDKIVTDTDLGPLDQPTDHTLFICEKENARAGAGGILFNLAFLKHEEAVTYRIFPTDTVLGVYKQGTEEYVLIREMVREMNYIEGNEDLKKAYENLSTTVNEVLIKTENMPGFTECGVDDLDWVEYE